MFSMLYIHMQYTCALACRDMTCDGHLHPVDHSVKNALVIGVHDKMPSSAPRSLLYQSLNYCMHP